MSQIETPKHKHSKFHVLFELIGAFGHILALIFMIIHLGKTEANESKWEFWGIISLLVISLIASTWFYFQNKKNEKTFHAEKILLEEEKINLQDKLEKAERYKEAYPLINNAFRDIHISLLENSVTHSVALASFCNNLAFAFRTITDEECHLAIKMIVANPDNKRGNIKDMAILTVVRDNVSGTERKRNRRKVPHYISENTSYTHIISKIRKGEKDNYFFSNDLLRELYYTNSSFKCFGMDYDEIKPSMTMKEKEEKWKLEYKSTIVVPIYPGPESPVKITNEKIYGFLCVHSPKQNIFDKEIDPDILSGCADGLINIVQTCYNSDGSVIDVL